MPRVQNARARVFSGGASVATPAKTPMKIPLNDDKREKANRLLSRQAQHEEQMSHIRNAATPLRKRRSLGPSGAPRTPNQDGDEEMLDVGGTAVTPMKRVPILANFEEWMKMATDNKINATNSWNFALIDYFHDMSLLKEGDGVNFQRASCTLDGCVKIYTNRVDSVATETGKLLSGLADSKEKKTGNDNNEEGEGDDEGFDDGEDGDGESGAKKRKRKAQRTAEATLVNSFTQLQLKKMELEFSVDPLFKKASADFDEGGAKGLLLNHLAIDGSGRIVFDSSDDAEEQADDVATDLVDGIQTADAGSELGERLEVDIGGLALKYFPDLAALDGLDVCPTLKDHALGDTNGSTGLPFIQAPEDWRDRKQGSPVGDASIANDRETDANAIDDGDAGLFDGLDMDDGIGFGQGGEAWAKEVALEPQLRLHSFTKPNSLEEGENPDDAGVIGSFDPERLAFGVSLHNSQGDDQENILNYFDQALQKNWAGPEHWKISRVKAAAKSNAAGTSKRREKEPFEVDFLAPMSQSLAEALYTPATSASVISLPKAQWRSKTRNLLPDDKHFSSKQLLRLFLKPKAVMGSRVAGMKKAPQSAELLDGEVDEAYWAQKEDANQENDHGRKGDYDANFFQDDGVGMADGLDEDEGDAFSDARERFSPAADGLALDGAAEQPSSSGEAQGAFGTQLVTQSRRLRPEYVQYARVAKKVDVRRLKEEIWRGLDLEEQTPPSTGPPTPTSTTKDVVDRAGELRFTEVVNSLKTVYPQQAMADISTSYCFICLLHLANEKGLVIENQENFTDLSIRRDFSAEIVSATE